MAARNEAQVQRVKEASALQVTQSPRHQRSDHQSHQRKPRRRSHESLCRDNAPLSTSSPSTMAEYYGGGGSRVTRTAGITGLLTVSEHAQQPPPPRSPGTSASASSQRSHQRQSPAVVAGSPRVPPSSHKAHKNDHLPIKASVSTPVSTESE